MNTNLSNKVINETDTTRYNRVFCFTGTGNSLFSAAEIAKSLNCQVTLITKELLDNITFIEADTFVLVLPSYAYGCPKLVKQFCKKIIFKCNYFAALVTAGTSSGGTLHQLKRILKRRKVSLDYGTETQSIENFMPIFGKRKSNYVIKRIEYQKQNTNSFISAVTQKESIKIKGIKPLSAFVSGLFTVALPILSVTIHISKKRCTNCKICQKVCPANAIKIKNDRVKIKATKCNQCQACLNVCPNNAITMLRKNKKCTSYINPNVQISDLIKR